MKINIIDAFVSVLAVWFFVPRLGLNGYIVVVFISELINFSFSFTRMIAVTGTKGILFRRFPLPLLAVTGAVCGGKLLGHLLPLSTTSTMAAATGMSLSAMGYLCLLLLFGVIPIRRMRGLMHKLFSLRSPSPVSHNS